MITIVTIGSFVSKNFMQHIDPLFIGGQKRIEQISFDLFSSPAPTP
jgi:hypothetical protein